MLSLGQLRVGSRIVLNNEPFEVLEANHLKMGRGGAKLVCKLRNYLSKAVIDRTFRGEERLEEAKISFQSAQYLYSDDKVSYFMSPTSCEQFEVTLAPERLKYLKEEQEVNLLLWNLRIIEVQLPKKVSLEVTYTEPGFKGNSVNATLKSAKLITGATVQVPLFVKTGDTIVIDTQTDQYDSRA